MRPQRLLLATFAALSLGAAVPCASHAQSAAADPTRPLITTSGRGEVHLSPDGASLVLSVESRAPSASKAASLTAAATASTLAALRSTGLTTSQLSTTGFTVSTDFRPVVQNFSSQANANLSTPPVVFVARNGVKVNVQTLTSLSKIIDAALAGGATQIGRVVYTSTAAEQGRRTALAQAVAQARADAEAIAKAAGGSLGPLADITATPDVGQGYFELAGAGFDDYSRSAPPPSITLAQGDVPINVRITARWVYVPAH